MNRTIGSGEWLVVSAKSPADGIVLPFIIHTSSFILHHSYFIIHTSYFHTSYFILHTSYFPHPAFLNSGGNP